MSAAQVEEILVKKNFSNHARYAQGTARGSRFLSLAMEAD